MMRCRPQLDLPLRDAPRWGGRRVGAGRKAGGRRPVPHRVRERFAGRFPCHVTVRLRRGVPSLRGGAVVRELEHVFAAGCERGEFRLVHYSLQEDHAHLLVEARDRGALARGMKSLGARLARAVNRAARRRGPVLAERYHLHVLRSAREVRNALAYVLLNARKHGRRIAKGRLDRASSGRWFDGWRGLPEGAAEAGEAGRPSVARARSWLLAVGWRRHGRIAPDEVPGRGGGWVGAGRPAGARRGG